MLSKQFTFDSKLLAVFNEHIAAWNKDEYILWALCYAPFDEYGMTFRTMLFEGMMEKKYGSCKLWNIMKEHISWNTKKDEKSRTMCKFFKSGFCKYGNFCKYSHSKTAPKKSNVPMIGQKWDDPIRKFAEKIGVTMYESDPGKKEMCTFFYKNKCHNDIKCRFSHHPSFMWNEMVSDLYPWISCDIPQNKFGLVFSISKKLEKTFNVIIKVPRKDTVEKSKCFNKQQKCGEKHLDSTVKLHGNPANVKKCINAMSNMLDINIFVVEGNKIVLDSDDEMDFISDSSDGFYKGCN